MSDKARTFSTRILHISDIHFRQVTRDVWRRRQVLDAWIRDLEKISDSEKPVDLVCITGDIANFGLPQEYEPATAFVKTVLDHFGLDRSRLFVVPGNHDIQRPIAEDEWSRLRDIASNVPALQFSRWMAGDPPPFGVDGSLRDAVLKRSAAYHAWVEHQLNRPELLPARSPHRYLGYQVPVTLPGRPFPIHVIGLDSAFLAGKGTDARHLRVTEDQVGLLASGDGGGVLEGLRIALIHHPLGDLADEAEIRRLLSERVDLLLRGHQHEPSSLTLTDPERSLLELAAGCLYEGTEGNKYPNAFQVIDVVTDERGRPLRYELWFRAWSSPGRHWYDDPSVYPSAQNGRLSIPARGLPAQEQPPTAVPQVQPRILVAGPYFGLTAPARAKVERLWAEGLSDSTRPEIARELSKAAVVQAQIGAVLRHDLIIDLSPWRAFARWTSDGLHDFASPSAKPADAPLLVQLASESDASGSREAMLSAVLTRLRERWPTIQASEPSKFAGSAVALSGFDGLSPEWCQPLVELWPDAVFVVDFDAPGQLVAKRVHSVKRLPPAPADLGVEDYLRALRVVAGQVMLAGDPRVWPVRDVFMDVEIAPLGQRRGGPESRNRQERREENPAESTEADIQAELDARKNAMLGIFSSSAVSTEALLTLAPRVFIWGNAGTGKSTLLRLLSCKAAANAHRQGSALQPLWLPNLEHLPSSDPEDHLVATALAAVHLPLDRTSPLYQRLRDSIATGKAHLFFDGFDEADKKVPEVLSTLHEGLFFHVASRPIRSPVGRFTEVELKGLTGPASQGFLSSYFGDQPWIVPLLRELRALPDGVRWTSTPVLLSLAAALYRRGGKLPSTSLELYGEVLGVTEADATLNQQRPLDCACAALSGEGDRQAVVMELSRVARKMLVPDSGEPQVSFPASELPGDMLDALRGSGLFIGTSRLRFAHLTFGEYFAARGQIDLSKARERWRAESSRGREEALEVLPMAHAFQGAVALKATLEEAEKNDTADHGMLRLLLRSIGYGGAGVSVFCEEHSAQIMALLVNRMQMPSGRFGDEERRLMDAGERALPVLKPYLLRGVGLQVDFKTALGSLLEVPGDVGTEAHILAWTLGLRTPERRISSWWATIHRMARAFVRTGLSVEQIVELTRGADVIHQFAALRVLAKYPAYRPPLRSLLRNSIYRLREDAIRALQDDEAARPLLRECLWDDQGRVRMAAVGALGGDSASTDVLAEKLEDRHEFVRHAAVRVLAPHPERWGELRKRIEDSDDWVAEAAIAAVATDPHALHAIREHLKQRLATSASYLVFHVDQVVRALRTDPLSRQLITDALGRPEVSFHAETLQVLAEDPEWRALVRKRVDEKDYHSVKALSAFPEFKSTLQDLLNGSEESMLIAAIEALAADPESVERIQPHLDSPEHNVCLSAINALSMHSRSHGLLRAFFRRTADAPWTRKGDIQLLRAHVVQVLASDPESRPMIEEALADKAGDVRRAAIEALRGQPESRSKIRGLLQDSEWRVVEAAHEAMADEPAIREQIFSALLNDYWPPRLVAFILLANEAAHRRAMQELLKNESSVRFSVFQPLSRDPESLELLYAQFDSLSSREHLTFVDLVRGDPRMKRLLRGRLQDMRDGRVRADSFRIGKYAEVLADDPESRPILQQLFDDDDPSVVAAVAPVMARDPRARPRLVELLSNRSPSLQAAAIKALAGDPEMVPRFKALLSQEKVNDHVRAAAVDALSAAPGERNLLRQYMSDPAEKVRDATFRALSKDPDSRGILWERLVAEEEDELRAKIAETLAAEPTSSTESRERLRACLADPVSRVRNAAAQALCPSPPPPAVPLERVQSLRIALSLAGAIHERLSVAEYSLQERLTGFLKAPAPFTLEDDPDLAEALLGWLCIRLAWSAADGAMHAGRVFGEVSEAPVSLRTLSEPLVIRVAMDASELPKERFLHPMHNLIEAWQVARFLHARTPPALVLACADVALEDLLPPTLAPGQVCWGPCYFGFRLGSAP